MFHQSSKQIILSIFVASLLITVPVYAVENFKTSNYGSAHQIWFEVEDFDERNPATDQYYSVVDAAGAFGKAINRGGPGGMIRWTFDISKAGGRGGTWYFWGRVIIPYNHSDFMIVEGDPGDPTLPAGPPFPKPGSEAGFTKSHRVFDENIGPPWEWGRSDHNEGHTKRLQDGENTMYILPREGGNTDFWDVFMWTDSPDYVPTDDDYRNAKAFVSGPATNPDPADGAMVRNTWLGFSWMPGDTAASHDVYISDNFADVNDGTPVFNITKTSFIVGLGLPGDPYPGGFVPPGRTYYWRIDEVEADGITVYRGDIWSFTTFFVDDMAYIPAGEFQMGDNFNEGASDERPVHTVTVDSFDMGKYEITNQQYCDYLNSADSQGLITVTSSKVYKAGSGIRYPYCDTHSADDDSQIDYSGGVFSVRTKHGRDMSYDPMVQVSWYGAVTYCNWRSREEGYEQCYNLGSPWTCNFSKKGYRLATEAEWEYAARGGAAGRRFPWGDTISHSQANYYAQSSSYTYDVSPTTGYHPTWNDGVYLFPYTSPVDSFAPNGYGLYGMAGNVREYCNDWYGEIYYVFSPTVNPQGPTSGPFRVLRGGAWSNPPVSCRSADRLGFTPNGQDDDVGFRIVLDSE
jgi:formylglycine-generating enzyme required for sulfatase activity